MKSVLLTAINRIAVVDQPTPQAEKGKSVIKILACGICGTDRHIYKGEYPSTKPIILGHEFGGVIEEPAPDSKFLKGDQVSVDPNIICGLCPDCTAGRSAFCPTLTALGVNINGGLAEFALVPDTQIYKVSKKLNPLHLAFIEPTACCIRGMDLANLHGGESVIVLGLAPEKTYVDFNPFQLVIKELRIQGSFLNPFTQRRAVDLIDKAKLILDPMISKVLSLDEVPLTLAKPPGQGDIKYVVVPN